MIEVIPLLYVGNQDDYEHEVKGKSDWSIVHACKEPYHRAALGYTGRAAPKDHPEYLVARRINRLILNMVDADNSAYIPKELVDSALTFINEQVQAGQKVLVHCNQGMSRSPSIALLYLVRFTGQLPKTTYLEAETAFRTLYPSFNPAAGVRGFMIQNWVSYTEPNQ